MENTFIIEIEKVTSQGYGLGFIEGKAIFVPFTYPDEQHEIIITNGKKSHSFAKSVKGIKIISARREPVCPLFGSCGGCQYQNVNYDYQLQIKKDILKESLIRIGNIDIEPNEIVKSEVEYRYRNKGSFQVKNGKYGYCYPGTTKVFHFEKCFLLDEAIEKHINLLEKQGKLENMRTINVRSNLNGEIIDSREKRASFIEEINGFKFIVDINSFFQVNKTMVPKWLDYIKSLVTEKDNNAVDLYCGIGIIAQYISGKLNKVTGIEINKRQIKQAEKCLEMNNIDNVNFITADAEEFLEHSGRKIGLLIVNPPRVGMSKWVVRDIVENPPKRIIYSSCNPDTFARDAAKLIEGKYVLNSIQPFDMFPQTHHLEIVADFVYKR